MTEEKKASANSATGVRARNARIDRDRQFLSVYFTNGMVVCDAEIAANPKMATNREEASRRGSRRLRRLRESEEWAHLLEAGGLDDLSLIAKARELLEARQTIIDSEGDEHDVVDNRTRLGALQTVGKWKGKEKIDIDLHTGPLEIKVSHETKGI